MDQIFSDVNEMGKIMEIEYEQADEIEEDEEDNVKNRFLIHFFIKGRLYFWNPAGQTSQGKVEYRAFGRDMQLLMLHGNQRIIL